MKNQYFDIEKATTDFKIPAMVLKSIMSEAKTEFPHDPMMYELHVLRAIKSKFWDKKHPSVRKRELIIA